MRVRRAWGLATLLALATAFAAVAVAVASVPGSVPTMAAGDARLRGELLEPYKERWRLIVVLGGLEREVGWVTEELRPLEVDGEPGLVRTRYSDDPLGAIYQRVVYRARGLAPLTLEMNADDTGQVRQDFVGGVFSATPSLLAVEPMSRTLALEPPAFDAGAIGLVLSLLDLADGESVRLPVYMPARDAAGITWVVATGGPAGTYRRIDGVEIPARQIELDYGAPGHADTYWLTAAAPFVERLVQRRGALEFHYVH